MKMTRTDFIALKVALKDTLRTHKLVPSQIETDGRMWDVFHMAWSEGRFDGNALYKLYNDAHIETAMRKIFDR